MQNIRILEEQDEVVHTLQDLQPIKFYWKNRKLYLTALSL